MTDDARVVDWQALALAALGEMRDNMTAEGVRTVQEFIAMSRLPGAMRHPPTPGALPDDSTPDVLQSRPSPDAVAGIHGTAFPSNVACPRPECVDNAKMRAVWAEQATRNADRMVTAERERDALRGQRDRLFAFLWELEREALSNRPVSIAKSAWGRIHEFVRNFPAPPSDVPPVGRSQRVISHYDDEAGRWVLAENWHAIEGPNGQCACGIEKGKCGERLEAFVNELRASYRDVEPEVGKHG